MKNLFLKQCLINHKFVQVLDLEKFKIVSILEFTFNIKIVYFNLKLQINKKNKKV